MKTNATRADCAGQQSKEMMHLPTATGSNLGATMQRYGQKQNNYPQPHTHQTSTPFVQTPGPYHTTNRPSPYLCALPPPPHTPKPQATALAWTFTTTPPSTPLPLHLQIHPHPHQPYISFARTPNTRHTSTHPSPYICAPPPPPPTQSPHHRTRPSPHRKPTIHTSTDPSAHSPPPAPTRKQTRSHTQPTLHHPPPQTTPIRTPHPHHLTQPQCRRTRQSRHHNPTINNYTAPPANSPPPTPTIHLIRPNAQYTPHHHPPQPIYMCPPPSPPPHPIPTPLYSTVPPSQTNHSNIHRSTCTFTPTCTNQKSNSFARPTHTTPSTIPDHTPTSPNLTEMGSHYSLHTYHLLPNTYYSPPNTCYLLRTEYVLRTTHYLLLTAAHNTRHSSRSKQTRLTPLR